MRLDLEAAAPTRGAARLGRPTAVPPHGANGLAKGAPKRFPILGADAIWAPIPPQTFVVAGLMVRGSLAMVCATGSSLKTWAVLDLTVSVASGRKWLGRFDCAKGPTLFVDWESGEEELRRRLQRLSAAPIEDVSLLTMPDLFFNSPNFEAIVTEWAAERALLVFDSLAAGTVDLDENDARFGQGLRILKRVAAATGCVVVVLHHNRKGRPDGDDDERDRARGTSAIYAACDVMLSLSRADEGAFQVRQTKARGGRAVEPFILRVEDVDGSTVVGAIDLRRPAAKTAEVRFEKTCRQILEAARKHPGSSGRSLIARVDGTDQAKWAAIEDLVNTGLLVNIGTPKRPQYRATATAELRATRTVAAVPASPSDAHPMNASQQFDPKKPA